VREALKNLLGSAGLQICDFASAEEFLNSEGPLSVGCLIVDVRMGAVWMGLNTTAADFDGLPYPNYFHNGRCK
jgi:FixJ family two-component response regulator